MFSYHRPNPSLTFTDICTCSTGRDSGLVGGVTENGVTESLTDLVQGGVFGDTATTKIFIMTPATFDLDLNTERFQCRSARQSYERRLPTSLRWFNYY